MDQVEKIQFKQLLKQLKSYTGNGTSLITLLIPPKKEIFQVNETLTNEYGTASNIKSRVNRLSVLSAITSAQQKLKLYHKTPKNGLCLLVGTISEGENVSRQVCFDFEPVKAINQFIYRCDARFHLEILDDLLVENRVFGFIVVNGDELLIAKISGNEQRICHHEKVTLPKKHGRGGQSALRFERHRTEAIHNYLRKVSEVMVRNLITDDVPNVTGLILAGSADLKTELSRSDLFDPRLHKLILGIVDISYGGRMGLQEAVSNSSEILQELEFVQEKKALESYFNLIATGSQKIVFGEKETRNALEDGLLESLYVNQDHLEIDQLILMATEKGTKMVFVSGNTGEGSQFIKGFGGLGGIARYEIQNQVDDQEDDFWDD